MTKAIFECPASLNVLIQSIEMQVGEMALSVKYLPCKLKDLTPEPMGKAGLELETWFLANTALAEDLRSFLAPILGSL